MTHLTDLVTLCRHIETKYAYQKVNSIHIFPDIDNLNKNLLNITLCGGVCLAYYWAYELIFNNLNIRLFILTSELIIPYTWNLSSY